MAWPTGYDTFTSPGSTLDSPPHSTLHTELSTRMATIQQTLGLTPQGGAATVDARLDAVEIASSGAGTWVDFTPILNNVSTGVGNVVARYRRLQQYTYACRYEFNFGAGSAITGVVTASVPFPPKTGSLHTGLFTVVRFGQTPRSGTLYIPSDSVVHFVYQTNTSGVWDATGPTTGTNGDSLVAEMIIESQSALS